MTKIKKLVWISQAFVISLLICFAILLWFKAFPLWVVYTGGFLCLGILLVNAEIEGICLQVEEDKLLCQKRKS